MLCTKLFTGCISSYNWIYPIVNEAVDKELDDDLDFNPERVIETILAVLRHPLMQQRESSVLLLNLGIHYPIGVNFTTYQKLIGDLINKLKETRVDSQGNIVPKYKAKIIWKTSSAIHKEKAQELNITHWRFFTTQVHEAVACRTGVIFDAFQARGTPWLGVVRQTRVFIFAFLLCACLVLHACPRRPRACPYSPKKREKITPLHQEANIALTLPLCSTQTSSPGLFP